MGKGGTSSTKVTKKVGYDPAADIKRGICGFENYKNKIPVPTDDEHAPISCEDHHTWKTG